MALKRGRYLHVQTPGGKFNGFSVFFYPHDDDDSKVNIMTTFCSSGDQFCRRTARVELQQKQEESVPVSHFPNVLAGFKQHALGRECVATKQKVYQRQMANQFAWVWKYFL